MKVLSMNVMKVVQGVNPALWGDALKEGKVTQNTLDARCHL
jgi:hypothetical protein